MDKKINKCMSYYHYFLDNETTVNAMMKNKNDSRK